MRVSRTPQRARSPLSSRASSPTRAAADNAASPPLLSPKPRSASGSLPNKGASPPHRLFQHSVSATGGSAGAHHNPIASHGHHGHAALGAHLSRPSSPSSIHSSSSAIFERDIEQPPASISLNSSTTLSHKSSRIFHPHGSNLEHTVPAVLDDAVEALTASAPAEGLSGLEIEAPASSSGGGRCTSATMSPGLRSRVASMQPRTRTSASRSPSPETMLSGSPSSPTSAPLSLSALSSHVSSPGSTLPPTSYEAMRDEPSSPTRRRAASQGQQVPGGWTHAEEDTAAARDGSTSGNATPVPTAIPSHLNNTTKEKRRISFISYNDLLLSVPTTVTSLNEITSGNLSPDHLPGTISPNVTSRSPVIAASASPVGSHTEHMSPLGGHGEWSREGLGKGLEQRLEDLILDPKAVA